METIFWDGGKLHWSEIAANKGEVRDALIRQALDFCEQWLEGKQAFEWQTSGSTGRPKKIVVKRSQMEASAKTTLRYLGLTSRDHALVCLHPAYIAGAMMLVRVLESGMDMTLVPPSGNPLENLPKGTSPTFTALVPLQVQQILDEQGKALQSLNTVNAVLVGGAAISLPLEERIRPLQPTFYATYGMTETVSHIALREIGRQGAYHILDPELVCRIQENGCLVIKGKVTDGKELMTNDRIAFVGPRTFKWLGRLDAVVNSGGVKVQPEQIEEVTLQKMMEWGLSYKLAIIGMPDTRLGQKVALVIEGELSPEKQKALRKYWKDSLPPYHAPKVIVNVSPFPLLPNGKIDRVTLAKRIQGNGNEQR